MGEGSGFKYFCSRAPASCCSSNGLSSGTGPLAFSASAPQGEPQRVPCWRTECLPQTITCRGMISKSATTHRSTTVHAFIAGTVTHRDRAAGVTRRGVGLHLTHGRRKRRTLLRAIAADLRPRCNWRRNQILITCLGRCFKA